MAGMGSAARGMKPNRRKYQDNEYVQELGLNWMDFHARQYDPQLGRFLGVDPLAASAGQDMFSPYAAMGNAPESMVDPNGELPTGMGVTQQSNVVERPSNMPPKPYHGPGAEKEEDLAAGMMGFEMGARAAAIERMQEDETEAAFFETMSGADLTGNNVVEAGCDHSVTSVEEDLSDPGDGDKSSNKHSKFSQEEVEQFQNATPPPPERARIVEGAYALEGSTKYEAEDLWGKTWKCNIFVYDVLNKAGASPGLPNGHPIKKILGMGSPPAAHQWANPNYKIPGWIIVKTPQAGDVVSTGTLRGGAHVAIMISPTLSMGANDKVVHITTFGSSREMLQHSWPGNNGYIFRRYVGSN